MRTRHSTAATVDASVMHFERTAGTAACGRRLSTAGFFTDDIEIMYARAGSRCAGCWRSLVARGEADPELSE